MKKLALALALSVSATGALAATESAGGVEWDTVDLGTKDGISASFSFQQWFTSGNYGTDVVDGQTVNTVTGASNQGLDSRSNIEVGPGVFVSEVEQEIANGENVNLTGVGVFDRFSDGRRQLGTPSYCTTGSGNCELTFAFGGIKVIGNGIFDASEGWLNVYYEDLTPLTTYLDADGNFICDSNTCASSFAAYALGATQEQTTTPASFGAVGSDAYTKFEEAQDGSLWGVFEFDSFPFSGSLDAGGVLGASVSIVGGNPDVVNLLDTNDFLGDFVYTADVNTVIDQGRYSFDAGGRIVTKVSAPSTIGIFGMSLLGLALFGRRKFSK